MEQNKAISPIVAGVIIAGVSIVFSLITSLAGNTNEAGVGLVQYLIIIVTLAILINMYGKANNFHKSFGDLFAYGFKATAIYTLAFLIFLVIFLSLQPDVKEKSLETVRTEMEKKGSSDSEIENTLEIARKYFWVSVVGATMFFLVLVGAIGSLLGAAITKKRPVQPIDQLDL